MKRQTGKTVLITIGIILILHLLTGTAEPHAKGEANNVNLSIVFTDQEIKMEVFLAFEGLDKLVKIERNNRLFMTDAEVEAAKERAKLYFRDVNPVKINGVTVKPVIKDVAIVPQYESKIPGKMIVADSDVRIKMSYPLKGDPRKVSFNWNIYPIDIMKESKIKNPESIQVSMDFYGDKQLVTFSKKEPEYIWHSPGKPDFGEILKTQEAKNRIKAPMLSAGFSIILVIILILLKLAGLKGSTFKKTAVFMAVLLIVGVGAINFLHASIRSPFTPKFSRPSREKAKEIFTTLHRNIYRAFDYDNESDIYDSLAESVDGELLDNIYREVYQSLVLREEGGAMCRIKAVKILDLKINYPENSDPKDTTFTADVRWQVFGAVNHWGHAHNRTNEYRARYKIAPRHGRWKIIEAETLDQKRIDNVNTEKNVK